VAVCAVCGDPTCPGHELEQSGERPIHRLLPWEDGETPPLRALWRTAMVTASDLERWVRASRSTGNGVAPAFTFALACELVAVLVTCGPLAITGAVVTWNATRDAELVLVVIGLLARVGLLFVPLMMTIHVVHQWVVARVGARHGEPIGRGAVLRAGLYACGWDLATGPAGVVAALLRLNLTEARRRAFGNAHLFEDSTVTWLRDVHGVEGDVPRRARRATVPFMLGLLVLACVAVAWAVVDTVR
jgi:hypothetical protein